MKPLWLATQFAIALAVSALVLSAVFWVPLLAIWMGE